MWYIIYEVSSIALEATQGHTQIGFILIFPFKILNYLHKHWPIASSYGALLAGSFSQIKETSQYLSKFFL